MPLDPNKKLKMVACSRKLWPKHVEMTSICQLAKSLDSNESCDFQQRVEILAKPMKGSGSQNECMFRSKDSYDSDTMIAHQLSTHSSCITEHHLPESLMVLQ